MPAKRLGLVVIGQSPRPEVAAEIGAYVDADVEIVLRGALDGLDRAAIGALAPQGDADTLFTRLPSGEAIKLSKHAVEQRARGVIAGFVAEGTTVTMLCCTGRFPVLDGAAGTVVLPSGVLEGIVAGLLPRGRLGIFVPVPEQVAGLPARWGRPGVEIVAEVLTPGADDAATDAAAARLAARAPDLVVMNCMSYTGAAKARVRRKLAVPVVLAAAAAGRIAAELLS